MVNKNGIQFTQIYCPLKSPEKTKVLKNMSPEQIKDQTNTNLIFLKVSIVNFV